MNDFDPNAAAKPGSGIFGLPYAEQESRVIVLPVPIDITTSYHPGTANGPAAILKASHQVDLFDRQFDEPYKQGIYMLPIPEMVEKQNRARMLAQRIIERGGDIEGEDELKQDLATVDEVTKGIHAWVKAQTALLLKRGKIVFTLGGDHSVSFGPIQAYLEQFPDMGVLHIDAHCDLRPGYEGFRFSHASVFYNLLTTTDLRKLVQVGIRDLSIEEFELGTANPTRIMTAGWMDTVEQLFAGMPWSVWCEALVSQLPSQVYISCDIDGLDPSLCPHTGTPVPGGLSFDQFCFLLREVVVSGRTIVGGDLVEVAPGPDGDDWDANVGARVLYKMIGAALSSQR